MYIMSCYKVTKIMIFLCKKYEDDTFGPISVTHKSEGLRAILEAETQVRIKLRLNIFHDYLSDIPNDFING
jgi:hypothetical protein